MQVPQRESWSCPPERLPDAFRMSNPKGDHTLTAVCEAWTHPFGRELRLTIDSHGLQMSSVVRSAEAMSGTIEQCRAAMLEKGWR